MVDKPLLFLFFPVHEGKRVANASFLLVHLSLQPGRKVTRITVFTRRHNGFHHYPGENILSGFRAYYRLYRMNVTGSVWVRECRNLQVLHDDVSDQPKKKSILRFDRVEMALYRGNQIIFM
jgi:hypothetical protein